MPVALISGASTGIGHATALTLAKSGWTVLAGVRNADAGEELRAGSPDGRVQPITLDVTSSADVASASEHVRGLNGAGGGHGRLDALINNAGIGVGGPVEVIDDADLRRQFDVNVFGQIALTRALLPALRAARGRIIFTSSIGGKVATPFTAPYGASKHAIEAFGDALRVELVFSGVQVALVEPGSVATPIWGKGKEEADRLTLPAELEPVYGAVIPKLEKVLEDTGKRGVPPETVAKTIEGALGARRMRARYLVGNDARVMLAMKRLLPDHVFDRVIRRAMGI